MKFFKKLKEKLFSTSSKLEGGLESLVDPKSIDSETKKVSEETKNPQSQVLAAGISENIGNKKNLSNGSQVTKQKVKSSLFGKIISSVEKISRRRRLDEEMLQDLEDLLITSDIGVSTSSRIVGRIRKENYSKELSVLELKQLISAEIYSIMKDSSGVLKNYNGKLNIWLFVGVNGSGKTTTIGKIAKQEKSKGRKVIIAAADTFRAAAVEQLSIWGIRTEVPVVKGEEKSDPASVVFKAIEKAHQNGSDLLLIDTAGRLQNKADLMQELEKIIRVIKKKDDTAPHNNILVLDATSGQNIHSQVDIFSQSAGITGIIMTKLDGTAKGGVLVALADKFSLPIHYVGLGEKQDDLGSFDPRLFANAIVGLDGENEI
ncbi:MAG: signal recognition particle-docking protein FtsY [Paracoccaceae bacterium]